MSRKFHLPYHFVPVKERSGAGDVPVADLRSTPHLGHHRWAEGTLSGRLLCRLTNETPLFVGAARHEDVPSPRVDPFELDGEPALPASSLRGLVSSIAEAASGSALRVLDDGPLSFRKPMGNSLSALGMIVEQRCAEGKSCLRLRPLTLPLMRPADTPGAWRLPFEYEKMYTGGPAHLKVYIGDCDSIRAPERFGYRTWRRDEQRYYGLELLPRQLEQGGDGTWILRQDEHQHPNPTQGRPMVLAQRPLKHGQEPRPWEELSDAEKKRFTRGIVRVLGCWGRPDIPANKRHELFLPYPQEVEEAPTFEILPSALERFHELADQRTEARKEEGQGEPLPYEPKDTLRDPEGDPDKRHFRLKDGDLVYFAPSDDDPARVGEIALAAIWRGRVESRTPGREPERAGARAFFAEVDPELVPFHHGRKLLTPAEQLFGFVAADKPAEGEERRAVQAQAGRVRFSMGRITAQTTEDPYLAEVTLKILANPKPPAPALYFRRRRGKSKGAISKTDLELSKHRPQGRKLYLHHRLGGNEAPWETRPTMPEDPRAHMKTRIRPLERGRRFLFHIDFENLRPEELALLCYALRPTEAFRHKLGMGKPLGLGTVRIDPLALAFLDRRRRYTGDGFFAPRHSHGWVDGAAVAAGGESGRAAVEALGPLPRAPVEHSFPVLRERFRETMDPLLARALEHLGEAVLRGVTHPVVEDQPAGSEEETFRWFVANEQGSGSERMGNRIEAARQALEPLDEWLERHPEPGKGSFPALDAHPWNE